MQELMERQAHDKMNQWREAYNKARFLQIHFSASGNIDQAEKYGKIANHFHSKISRVYARYEDISRDGYRFVDAIQDVLDNFD